MKKRTGLGSAVLALLFLCLLAGMIPAQRVQAAVSAKAWKKINGVCYNGSGKKIPGAITRGIDVSAYQDVIDWEKVKNSDVDFAFIRVCHGLSVKDTYCAANLTKANLAGVPVGTYVYSMAKTEAAAIKEAQYAIKMMQGHLISYPVVLDLEDSSLLSLSSKKLASVAKAFLNEIEKAGYYPMIYCNTSWYTEKLVPAGLTDYDIWIARFGDTIQAPDASTYQYTIWQGTDGNTERGFRSTKGLVDGIPTYNNVDIDFGYVDYTRVVIPRTQSVSTYEPTKVGWITKEEDKYYYVKDQAVTGWYTISGKAYYFDSTGKLQTGKLIKDSEGNISFTDANGVKVAKGWLTYQNKKYYIRSTGYAAKGIVKLSKKYYYFNTKNAYLLYSSQKVVSPTGNIYYFDKNGARTDNSFVTITEKGKKNTYYFGKNGVAYKGWNTISKKKYFFYSNGVMAKSVKITNPSKTKTYVFNSKGVLTKTIVLKKETK